jgi:phosphatidylglycerol:prolipoprotein diacylglycerol transferase
MDIDRFGILINGNYLLKFYALIIIVGAFLAGYLASVQAKRRGHNPEIVWDALFWIVLAGIVGARLWHILTPPQSMVDQGYDTAYYLNLNHWVPVDFLGFRISLPAALATPNGGLGIPGAVIGGVLAFYIFARRAKLNFAEWMDIAAPCLALGQAIGRWANYINEELYGRPTTLPWAISIDAALRLPGYTDPALKFHPLFFYESLGTALICVGLLYLGRRLAKWLKFGDLFLIYLIAYPTLRFFLEFLRLDRSPVFGVDINQVTMAVVAVAAGLGLAYRHRRPRKLRRYEQKEKGSPETPAVAAVTAPPAAAETPEAPEAPQP